MLRADIPHQCQVTCVNAPSGGYLVLVSDISERVTCMNVSHDLQLSLFFLGGGFSRL
jgi:hypothetical protein